MNGKDLFNKIPDVYFDWYGRLIPGIIAVFFYFYNSNTKPTVTLSYILVYAIIAYTIGHIIQPLSSLILNFLQTIFKTDNKLYSKAKKKPELYSLTLKVSKAYAESIGMLSSAILIILIMILTKKVDTISILVVIYFILSTIERTIARKRKIEDIEEI